MKQNRKPGIHLHKTKVRTGSIKTDKVNKDLYEAEYYWILIARNGKTIAKSSETYKRKGSAVRSMAIAADVFKKHFEYFDHSRKETELIIY